MTTYYIGTQDHSLGAVEARNHLSAWERFESRHRRTGLVRLYMDKTVFISDGDDSRHKLGREWHEALLVDAYGDDYRAKMDAAEKLL